MPNSITERIASLDWNLLQQLRTSFYPELAKTANRWLQQLGRDAIYPYYFL
jgi:hypothetical protein